MKLAVAVLLAACTHVAPAPTVVANTVPPPPAASMAMCTDGDCLPALDFTDTGGRVYPRASFAGHVVVISFLATWAHPAMKFVPILSEAARTHRADAMILGILVDTVSDADFERFITDVPSSLPYIRSTKEILTAFKYPDTIPQTFVFDRGGHLVEKVVGGIDPTRLEALLQTAQKR